MIRAEDINRIFGITESFELPDKCMKAMLDKGTREKIFNQFLELESNLEVDWFTNYFQEQHSNRESMMQDFTPAELAALLPEFSGSFKTAADICSGTGGLTIAAWRKNKDCFFRCEELSARALPLLLFNLSIRNINAVVVNSNVLTGETYGIYRIEPQEKYSSIHTIESDLEYVSGYDLVMLNPPYSLKWKPDETSGDIRFEHYGYAPAHFADYAFVLHALHILDGSGTLCAILPHGILFRGGKEGEIRRRLINDRIICGIIGLPDKLFLNTGIPVCIMICRKDRPISDNSIFFVDASKEYVHRGKINILSSMEEIKVAFQNKWEIKRFSAIAEFVEIERNDYNLNISRYVDTYEPPPRIDIIAVTNELFKIQTEESRLKAEIYSNILQMTAKNDKQAEELEAVKKIIGRMVNGEQTEAGSTC